MWNRFPIEKFADWCLVYVPCEEYVLEYRYVQVWINAEKSKQSPLGWFLPTNLELLIATSFSQSPNQFLSISISCDYQGFFYDRNEIAVASSIPDSYGRHPGWHWAQIIVTAGSLCTMTTSMFSGWFCKPLIFQKFFNSASFVQMYMKYIRVSSLSSV